MPRAIEPVGIAGAGAWGTALAQLAAEAGRDVMVWMRDPEKSAALNDTRRNPSCGADKVLDDRIRATADLAEFAGFSQYLLIAIPAYAFREVMASLGEYLGGSHVLVHTTKGIDLKTRKRMSEIIREETPVKRIGMLSGPTMAEEILRGLPAAAVVASKYPEVVERSQTALVSSRFRVYGAGDLVGVELAGALKNIIAICAGIIDGQRLGYNALSMLITRGAAEIQRFGMAMGADPATFAGLSGIGDLIATCASPTSVHRQAGFRLSRGESVDEIIRTMPRAEEGFETTRAVRDLAAGMKIDMPVTAGVNALLFEGAVVKDVLDLLMTRRARYEKDAGGTA